MILFVKVMELRLRGIRGSECCERGYRKVILFVEGLIRVEI